MKKNILYILTIISSLCLLSCSQEMLPGAVKGPSSNNSTFDFIADITSPKTTLDDNYNLSWENGDVIYAVTTDGEWGKPYSEDETASTVAEFTYSDSDEKFTTSATISSGEHTFNFLYGRSDQKSYHRGASTSYNLSSTVSQDCTEPRAHLKNDDALYAQISTTTPVSSISATMNHLFTLMRVNITNNTGSEITLNCLTFTANNNIAGVYTVNFATGVLAEKTKLSKTITVNLSNGSVANDGTIPVYFVMAPLTGYTGMIKMVVTDNESNTYTKQMTISTAKSFEAGKFNIANCSLTTKDGVLDGSDAKLTSSEISSTLTTSYTEGTYTNKYGIWSYNSMKATSKNNAIQINSGKYIGTPALGTYIKTINLTLEESSTKTITILDELGTSEVTKKVLDGTEAEIDIESYHLNKVRITSDGVVYIKKITVSYSQGSVTPTQLTSPIITCESHSSSQLVFSWTPVLGATGYLVSWNGGTEEEKTATSFTKSGLDASTQYTISVKAKGNGCGQTTSEAASCSQKTDEAGTVSYVYKLVGVDDITAGTYVIGALRSSSATDNFYFATGAISSGDMVVSTNYVTVPETTVESVKVRSFSSSNLPSGAVEFTLMGNNTDGFTIKTGTNYLGCTDFTKNRKLVFNSTYSTSLWTFTSKTDPLLNNGVVINYKGDNKYIISENSTGTGAIRGYPSTTYRAIYLFEKVQE